MLDACLKERQTDGLLGLYIMYFMYINFFSAALNRLKICMNQILRPTEIHVYRLISVDILLSHIEKVGLELDTLPVY